MAEEKPEKGTRENPLTREDVLRMIEERGGTADGLNLSGMWFERGIDLSQLNLGGIILTGAYFPARYRGPQLSSANFDGCNLTGANLRGADLRYATFNAINSQNTCLEGIDIRAAHLENAEFVGADLIAAQFQRTVPNESSAPDPAYGLPPLESLPSYLENTDLRGTTLRLANFRGCRFYGTKLQGAYLRGAAILDAYLEDTDWGDYVIGEETRKDELHFAQDIYRRLKVWYTNSGYPGIAAEFYYREKEAGRKSLRWCWSFKVRHRLALEFLRILFGYGEKWRRIVYWIIAVVLGCTLTFYCLGGVAPFNGTAEAFLSSLYFSTVSFTALGYGPWFSINDVRGWAQAVGAAESFLGVLMMAAMLVTFVRKWTR